MHNYDHLTTSEYIYIIDKGQVKQRDHFYYTIMDLLLKDVIRVPSGYKVSPDENVNYEYSTFISKGPNFDTYTFLPHEDLFCDPYKENPKLILTIMRLIRQAHNRINSFGSTFRSINSKILKYKHLQQYFQHKTISRFFKINKLNEKGESLAQTLTQQLNSIHNLSYGFLKEDQIKEAIDLLGSKILLINDLNFDLIIAWIKTKNKYRLPFNKSAIENDRLSDQQLENIKAIAVSFEYFYNQVLAEIERENNGRDFEISGL